uniref:Uncharacterized protein n=1 Tax=Oryza punctata TaxID=4537 RepID=A0A0E0JPT7_ORYPU
MSQTPDADSARDTFTCGTLFMCLNRRGFSKKKPEEVGKSRRQPPATEQDHAAAAEAEAEAEQEPQYVPVPAPVRAASFEKLECSPPYSGSNIAFDLFVEPELGEDLGARPVLAYCPSPCFDLPVGLMMRAGERCDAPGTAGYVFDGGPTKGALKKVVSCLPPDVAGGDGEEARLPHLVRFLSTSGSTAPANGGLP